MATFDSDFQDAQQTACRTLCLAAIFLRGESEQAVRKIPPAFPEERRDAVLREHENLISELQQWLKNENLWDTLPDEEARLWEVPLGYWTEQDILVNSWRCESAGVLLWSLGYYDEMPSYDKEFDTEGIFAHLCVLRPAGDFIKHATLLDVETLDRQHTIAELWQWRAEKQLPLKGRIRNDEEVAALELTISQTADLAVRNGDLEQTLDGDFPALGKAYRDLDEQQFLTLYYIARSRMTALNWLCGMEDRFEEFGDE